LWPFNYLDSREPQADQIEQIDRAQASLHQVDHLFDSESGLLSCMYELLDSSKAGGFAQPRFSRGVPSKITVQFVHIGPRSPSRKRAYDPIHKESVNCVTTAVADTAVERFLYFASQDVRPVYKVEGRESGG